MPASLGTVIFFTRRMEELASFYAEGLGVTPFEGDHQGHLGGRVGEVYLGFDQVEEWKGAAPSAVTPWFTVDDLPAAFERFVALGAQVRYGPTRKPWGATLASLVDLDGNVFGLAQRAGAEG